MNRIGRHEDSVAPAAVRAHAQLSERWVTVAFIGTALLASFFLAEQSGVSARRSDTAAVVTQTATETVAALESLNARGAVALVVTEDLGYSPVAIETSPGALAWPAPEIDLRTLYRAGADRDSWLWVLAKTGVVRRIDYLVPPAELRRKIDEGRALGYPGIARDGHSILANDEGFVRYIASAPRHQDAPLVVIVDASYFRSGVAAELATRLQQVDVVPTAVVLYRATEDTSVPDAARRALDGAAAGFGGEPR